MHILIIFTYVNVVIKVQRVYDMRVEKIISELIYIYNTYSSSEKLFELRKKIYLYRQFPYKIQVIAEKLYVPWAIAISEDGSLYFTERSGAIRKIKNEKLLPDALYLFGTPFVSQGEGGLMGIALDPNFSQNHFVYVMHSIAENNKTYNRVARLIENNDRLFMDKILIDKIPGGQIHNGGRIKIGVDNKLYITTGDSGNPSLAQDPLSTAGKILRINLDGSIPKDNPFPNSPIYSLGHRNPEGLAWNSENVLYESEHGSIAHDEINIIEPGKNYGWPIVEGNEEATTNIIQKPLIQSGNETWAPSGITFISQGPWKNKLLMANLRGQQLILITLDEKGVAVTMVESLLKGEYGRLREVIEGKDGSIFLTTSNMDGRGNPNINDDKIIQLTLQ